MGISIFATICIFFIPESPSWLVAKNRIDDAEKSLKFIRDQRQVDDNSCSSECRDEIDGLIEKTRSINSRATETFLEKFQQPELYKPLLIMIVFFAFQQLSGIFVIIIYAVKFSRDAGIAIDPFLCAVYIGVVRMVGTLLIGVVMDRFGRRIPAMFSGISMGICMFGIAAYINWPIASLNWLPLMFILSYIFTSSLGLLTIPFTMLGEIFPQRYRGFASGLAISAVYIVSFGIVKLYPSMVQVMGTVNVLLFYGMVSFISCFFVYFFLPETKGKTLDQIEEIFRRKNSKTSLRILSKNSETYEKCNV